MLLPGSPFLVQGPATLEDWHAQHSERPLRPDIPIVDAHHHLNGAASSSASAEEDVRRRPLWSVCAYGARAGGGRHYMEEQLLSDVGKSPVVATVYMQCGQFYDETLGPRLAPVGETRRCQAIADSFVGGGCRLNAGIVSYADLSAGLAVESDLHAHMAASQNFRGVRNGIAGFGGVDPSGELRRLGLSSSQPGRSSPDHPYDAEQFRDGVRVLARLGLTLDAWCYHPQLPELVRLARAVPEATIICNHAGGPLGWGPYKGVDGREQRWREWAVGIHELALCPNVLLKLSGLTMPLAGFGFEQRAKPPDSLEVADVLAPYLRECLQAFGARRCMFASNFPVDAASCSYTVLWNAFHRTCDLLGLPSAERAAAFAGTATEVYRLGALPGVSRL